MKKRENVQMLPGQLLELGAAVLKALPHGMSTDVAQGWIGNANALKRALRSALMPPSKNGKSVFAELLVEWQAFYKNHFMMDYDFSQVRIPERPEGNWRLLIIENVSIENLYARCSKLFQGKAWRWTNDDFDQKVAWNERDAKNGAYAIWVKDVQEADEELKNLSANEIKSKGVKTETLAERLMHEIKFFQETGDHLDKNNVTLCAGSQYSDGRIPRVDWVGDRMFVYWCIADYADDNLRSREVVS